MRRKLTAAILFAAMLAPGTSLLAKTLQLQDPVWEEVPGTLVEGDPDFSGSVYIDTSGIVENGPIRVFDVQNVDASYARLELDCVQRRYRATQQGDFESATVIRYVETPEEWRPMDDASDNDTIRAIATFVCDR
jgi:hypothetical protein